eukprot:GHVR01045079.1.p1 GENE.GHVR01045079.1~~GHVR01045079.1.p1  ORF type:complete len:187 (+),score=12.48 GHVR01045079.1:50-610(+)
MNFFALLLSVAFWLCGCELSRCQGPNCRKNVLRAFYSGNIAKAFKLLEFPINPYSRTCCEVCDSRFTNRKSLSQCNRYCTNNCKNSSQCPTFHESGSRPNLSQMMCTLAKMTCNDYSDKINIFPLSTVPQCIRHPSLDACYDDAELDLSQCLTSMADFKNCGGPDRFKMVYRMYFRVPCNLWTVLE